MNKQKLNQFLKVLGPGVMFAGTCIGGSHLIQSTKAGAFYGFGLLAIVLIANVLKYPFFEFASRYTNSTGDSILEGYKKMGKFPIALYGIVTFFSMFIITAAIIAFTSGLANNLASSLFDLHIDSTYWPIIISIIVLGLLSYGKFKILDIALKTIGVILVLSIGTAFFSTVNQPLHAEPLSAFDIIGTTSGFAFAIYLMGWMPMGVDMSAWHSLWTQERIKQTGYHPKLKETLLDFNIGYGITVVLAFFFLSIGAKVMYGVIAPETIQSASAVEYANLLVNAFTQSIGSWSLYIISIAAFATMFGTAITLSDGYTRAITRTVSLLRNKEGDSSESKQNYLIWIFILFIGSYLIISLLGKNLGQIMNLATGTSFVIAPIAAFFNFKIVNNKKFKKEHQPPKWLNILAIVGLIFLTLTTIGYLYVIF